MSITLAQLAHLASGTLQGDGEVEITGAAILRDVQAGEITLCDRVELLPQLAQTSAAAAVVPAGVVPESLPCVVVEDVSQSFARIVYHFRPPRSRRHVGVSPGAHVSRFAKLADDVQVHPGATIGDDVSIGAGTVIHSGVHIMAGCRIGAGVTIFPTAVLYEDTLVGDNCIIHAGAVLGAFGFGYDTHDGRHHLSPQVGYVVLENDVEVGAGTTIDRGTYGPTIVGEGTKIDNQFQVSHNVRVGKHNILCGQGGIAGSSTTGDYVVMAGQVGVKDHVNIGDQVTLGAMSGVMTDVPSGETYVGQPAGPAKEQFVRAAAMTKLPEMRKQLRELQKQIDALAAERPSEAA